MAWITKKLLFGVGKGHDEHKLKDALIDVESSFEVSVEILLIHFFKFENPQGIQIIFLINVELFLLPEA